MTIIENYQYNINNLSLYNYDKLYNKGKEIMILLLLNIKEILEVHFHYKFDHIDNNNNKLIQSNTSEIIVELKLNNKYMKAIGLYDLNYYNIMKGNISNDDWIDFITTILTSLFLSLNINSSIIRKFVNNIDINNYNNSTNINTLLTLNMPLIITSNDLEELEVTSNSINKYGDDIYKNIFIGKFLTGKYAEDSSLLNRLVCVVVIVSYLSFIQNSNKNEYLKNIYKLSV
jgi:hypothetical protein